jgi:hypothetical protein
MERSLIIIILILLLYSGWGLENYRIRKQELPWWILVTLGFVLSCWGLLYSNDDRMILSGCFVLLIANLYSYWDSKKIDPKEFKKH